MRTIITKRWQNVLVGMVVFFSLTTGANGNVIAANTPHATRLITQYLRVHPVGATFLIHAQANAIHEINQLVKTSAINIAEKIEHVGPAMMNLSGLLYPVISPSLTPGKVVTRSIQTSLPQPIFIVGDDEMSKQWLRDYKKRLLTLNATGFVVNVNSMQAMAQLQQQFPQLPLMAIRGDELAKWLKLKHYPVLISNKLIEQ